MQNICRQSHCPLEILFGNFYCYSTAYCTSPMLVSWVWGNNPQFYHIPPHSGMMRYRISPCFRGLAHRVLELKATAHPGTPSGAKWIKVPHFPAFSRHIPGYPWGLGGRWIHWLVHKQKVRYHKVDSHLELQTSYAHAMTCMRRIDWLFFHYGHSSIHWSREVFEDIVRQKKKKKMQCHIKDWLAYI